MADFNEKKTVVVNRDTADVANRTSPVGWILLLVALLVIAFFLLMGGTRIFNNNTPDGTRSGGASTSIDETSSPMDNITPAPDSTTMPEATSPTGTQGIAQ